MSRSVLYEQLFEPVGTDKLVIFLRSKKYWLMEGTPLREIRTLLELYKTSLLSILKGT